MQNMLLSDTVTGALIGGAVTLLGLIGGGIKWYFDRRDRLRREEEERRRAREADRSNVGGQFIAGALAAAFTLQGGPLGVLAVLSHLAAEARPGEPGGAGRRQR